MLKRVHLKFNFSFIFIITFSLVFDKTGITFYSLVACLLHEAGHILVMLFLENCDIKISFTLRGIAATTRNLKHEKICLAAGPAANFLLFSLYPFFPAFAAVNLIVGGINIIPVSENDGARLLHLYLIKFYTIGYSEILEKIIGILFLIPLIGLLFYVAITNPHNYTLLVLIIYLIMFLIEGRGLD